jgi:epsilon-lactone hydrolase
MKYLVTALAASAILAFPVVAQQVASVDRYAVPSTVSREASERLQFIYSMVRMGPKLARPGSLADWDQIRSKSDEFGIALNMPIVDALKVSIIEDRLGNVPVVRVRPANWKSSGKTLIYIHGGGYVSGSARSTLGDPASMAAVTGFEVISIDYTVAPRGKWQTVTDEVLSVWQALLATGIKPQNVGMFGGSAGGGLAAGSVLKMRDKGLPLPAALYLQSPWSDITATGDTVATLAGADPMLDLESLGWGANEYAAPKDQKHPYVSPVYGDYSKPFPATLIQVGTREMFLSHAARHYQAIRSGGHEAVLDVYEGMPHGFPSLFTDAPEGRTAIARAGDFFRTHLRSARRSR